MRQGTYLNVILTVNAVLLAGLVWTQVADTPLLAETASAQSRSRLSNQPVPTVPAFAARRAPAAAGESWRIEVHATLNGARDRLTAAGVAPNASEGWDPSDAAEPPGVGEFVRSLRRGWMATGLRRLVPELRAEDLRPGGAGVRAQAVDHSGALVDDFVIHEAEGAVHVLNAPSPGATASLAIGNHVATRVEAVLGLS